MAGPYDYSINVATPFQSALQGYQTGAAIRDDGLQAQQKQLELQAQQAKLQAAQRQQELLGRLASNPNASADDYANVMTQIPALAENLSKVWTVKNAAQQQTHAADLLKWGAAIKSGEPQIAVAQMRERAGTMEAAGQPQQAAALRANAGVLEQNPRLALGMIQAQLASSPLGKDAAETLSKFGTEERAATQEQRTAELHPSNLAESQAKAQSAITGAKFAESKAVQDLKLGEAQIKKMAEDTEIARMNSRIAAMNAATSREGNALKRDELRLKLDEAITKRDEKVREKVATAESGAANIDNMLNTIQRIQGNKSLNSVLGSVEGSAYYPNAALGTLNPLGNGDERADAIALIDTLGSQAFLAQIPNIKGMGALSNAEGEKLQSAFQNLSRKQSESQFRANLNEASRLLNKGRAALAKSSGVDLGRADTPAAPGARPPLSSFQR